MTRRASLFAVERDRGVLATSPERAVHELDPTDHAPVAREIDRAPLTLIEDVPSGWTVGIAVAEDHFHVVHLDGAAANDAHATNESPLPPATFDELMLEVEVAFALPHNLTVVPGSLTGCAGHQPAHQN